MIVAVDESGFQLLPSVERTYAPVGQTPELQESGSKEHWSVISAITPTGRLLTRMQDHAFTGPDVVRFLQHLERELAPEVGKIQLLWDRAPIHTGVAVREFLAQGHTIHFELHLLPGYAPDLNPDEAVWSYVKGRLANVSCLDLPELRADLRREFRHLQRHPELMHSFFQHVGFS